MERRAPLDCHVVFLHGSTRSVGRARDISTTDIYVYTKEPTARGADVIVEVILPYQFDTLALAGTVRTVRPGLGMDVQFVGLEEAQLRSVSDYIDARLRRSSGTRPSVVSPPADEEKKSAG